LRLQDFKKNKQINKLKNKKKDTFNALLGAVELGELICKNLLTENTIHPTSTQCLSYTHPPPKYKII
jgi:hypothetical protein